MATHDEAYFFAVVAQSAAYFSLFEKRGDPMDAITHRMKAVKLVNSRIGVPALETSDGTIATVACIANYEVSISRSSQFLLLTVLLIKVTLT